MIYVLIYLSAIVLANLLVLWFGPKVTVINALVLIGLDLTVRDRLHDRWHHRQLWLKMFLLIFAGSLITYLLNRSSLMIGIASVVAFSSAAVVDSIIYSILFRKQFLIKANGSNVGGALVDSVLFPTIAFGVFMPLIVIGQFLAKVSGGFFWSMILDRLRRRQ
ncbi:MAG: VUT family protein [candidate division KSB1 bacterium]|nr:VUT family protein [candidate division KSB1 bacterium]MDZ7334727.1 VUT family protein [candidate division KSB1 bacterium]MDZ7358255.1 VUT family protein [candidate division KSB1 bacterium]MDZ7400374.1 VUT family protein [candidate division KSB1 bacterium]